MEQECHRIRYSEMVVKGLVRMVRRRVGGGYFTILTPPEGAARTKRVAFRSPLRPRRRRLPRAEVPARPAGVPGDLPATTARRQRLRAARAGLRAAAAARPGTVLVRGGGIVASRVLQRLIDDRDARGLSRPRSCTSSARTSTARTARTPWMRRPAATAGRTRASTTRSRCGAGSSRRSMRKLEGQDRAALYKVIGGTNTPEAPAAGRRRWRRGRAGGLVPGASRARSTTVEPGPRRHRPGAAEDRDAGPPERQVTTSSTAPGSRPTSPSTGCSPICWTTAAPAATRSAGWTSSATSRCGAPRSGDGRAVRVRHGHAGWLLPGRRHLPRPADRRAGDHRRPRRPGLLQERSARSVRSASGAVGPRPKGSEEATRAAHAVRTHPDPDLPAAWSSA